MGAQTQNNLANAYSERIRGEKAQNIEQAIASYTNALSVYTRDAFPEAWLRRKIIWHLPTIPESGEIKLRISNWRSHLTPMLYSFTPAMPFPNNGQGRKIIWHLPTVKESGERKLRISNRRLSVARMR